MSYTFPVQVNGQLPIAVSRLQLVPIPRRNSQELRSYDFFLHVTAPAFAGVFDSDFWFTQLPQTCHKDPAIWHAVVSLAAVHESTLTSRIAVMNRPLVTFALQQFNASVKHLVHLSSPQKPPDGQWRALVASILFTYLCSIQGMQGQSDVHLAAAKNLVKELHVRKSIRSTYERGRDYRNEFSADANNSSVSYESLRSIVASLEIHMHSLANDGLIQVSPCLDDSDAYAAWRLYSGPTQQGHTTMCQHGRCVPSRATRSHLARAGRAFESLLNEVILFLQQSARDLPRFVVGASENIDVGTLIRCKPTHVRAFRELEMAIGIFLLDTSCKCSCFEDQQAFNPVNPQKKAIDTLRLYYALCYILIFNKPNPPAPTTLAEVSLSSCEMQGGLTRHFSNMLDIAESVLQMPPALRADESGLDSTPTLPTSYPLLIAAHNGPTLSLRERAIWLLRQYPRRQGLRDSLFAAALAEVSLRRELEFAGELSHTIPEAGIMAKMYRIDMTFTGPHSAHIVMQTWGEWAANQPGKEGTLMW
jgi:hypothetical protein